MVRIGYGLGWNVPSKSHGANSTLEPIPSAAVDRHLSVNSTFTRRPSLSSLKPCAALFVHRSTFTRPTFMPFRHRPMGDVRESIEMPGSREDDR